MSLPPKQKKKTETFPIKIRLLIPSLLVFFSATLTFHTTYGSHHLNPIISIIGRGTSKLPFLIGHFNTNFKISNFFDEFCFGQINLAFGSFFSTNIFIHKQSITLQGILSGLCGTENMISKFFHSSFFQHTW